MNKKIMQELTVFAVLISASYIYDIHYLWLFAIVIRYFV